MKLDAFTMNEWLQADMQWLHQARTAVNAYRQGQAARRDIDDRQKARAG